MTDAQYQRLPEILREVVDCDRRIKAARATLVGSPPTMTEPFATLVRLRRLRRELSERAAGRYGTPLRGDNGPGRPTAARAA